MLCARVSLAAALLSQHVDCETRAGSPGTESRSRAHSLVQLTMLAPVVENRTVGGPARARRPARARANSEIADGYATGSSAHRGVAVIGLPTSSVSAVQLVLQYMCSAPTPPVSETRDRAAAVRLEYRNGRPASVARTPLWAVPLSSQRDQKAAPSNRRANLVSVAVTSQWCAQEAAGQAARTPWPPRRQHGRGSS
jgi:hypothetical protein